VKQQPEAADIGKIVTISLFVPPSAAAEVAPKWKRLGYKISKVMVFKIKI
jgi:hypothetical protein